MIRAAALCAALAPIPALACEWGMVTKSTATAVPTESGGEVLLHNELTAGHDMRTTCVLPLDGVGDVGVGWNHVPGSAPDDVTVTPPAGWMAEPPEVAVPEGGDAVVLIRPELIG